jgi:CspA family cold shock protein
VEPSVPHAVVRWFDADRGFGFLALDDGGEDLFVHASEIAMSGGSKLLREGQSVEFEVGEGDRGPQALRVRVTGELAPDSAAGVLGTVVWYEPSKGYGFVEPDGGGSQIFVHSSAIITRGVISEGQRVAFLVVEGERGPQAEHLLPLASGVGRPAASDGADDGADGTVSWYDEGKGFGFVSPDSGADDVFVHGRCLVRVPARVVDVVVEIVLKLPPLGPKIGPDPTDGLVWRSTSRRIFASNLDSR